ncbi:MAG: type IX secretion system outer membrane channel protein PorV [Bacteroidales bacterium]|nr:type IX secretion system outer membrane channel protein PorV [Bacteroidales bacterium]
MVFSFCVASVKAQVNPTGQQYNGQTIRPLTTAVSFLQIGPDARIGGMGEAGVAVPNDVNAQHWNAAKYAFSKDKFGVSVNYSPWLNGLGLGLNDIYLAYLSGYYKLTSLDAISFSLTYFSMGEMDITNYEGKVVFEDVRPHEFALDAGYSRRLTENFSMGVTGRFIYSNLTTVSGVSTTTNDLRPGLAGAADVSLFYQRELAAKRAYKNIFGAGLTVSNIGNKISYSEDMDKDFLPANFRLGLAYTTYIDKFNKLTFAFDVNKLLVPSTPIYKNDTITNSDGTTRVKKVVDRADAMIEAKDPYEVSVIEAIYRSWLDAPGGMKEELDEFILNVGVEYTYNDLFSLRCGYFNEAKTKGARKYFTFGAGLKYSMVNIDVSYIAVLPVDGLSGTHPLKNTLRIGLTFNINAPDREASIRL